jgi:cytochrome c peroxidase
MTSPPFQIKKTIACCCFAGFLLIVVNWRPTAINTLLPAVDIWYLSQIDSLEKQVVALDEKIQQGKNESIRNAFLKTRLAYKKMEGLIEFYDPAMARMFNGPAIERVEEDYPDKIIQPQGLQVIETHLYPSLSDPKKIHELINALKKRIEQLRNETDRALKFNSYSVLQAVKMQVYRVITLGISGYDSPLALSSLPESVSSLQACDSLIHIYAATNKNIEKSLLDSIDEKISKAINYLRKEKDFNRFDRLIFITTYANPLSQEIHKLIQKEIPTGSSNRQPLQAASSGLFDTNTFNLEFFSSNKRYGITKERVQLGQLLFNDPILSINNKRSCATCHRPDKALTDGLKIALDIDGKPSLNRNTIGLWNSALQTRQFYDLRTDNLENQLSEVVHNKKELGRPLNDVANLLLRDSSYTSLFRETYKNEPSTIDGFLISNAISNYVRSLISLNSRFDQFMQGEKTKLTAQEKNGFNLVMGKAKCATCHFLPLFNGLVPPAFAETESEVLGVPSNKQKKNAVLDKDEGRFLFTRSPIHRYSFKTPTLRNITLTAPYMHNGVYATLEEVLEFYNNGGGMGLGIEVPHQTLIPGRLHLTKKEIKDVIAFMGALTDTSGISFKKMMHF